MLKQFQWICLVCILALVSCDADDQYDVENDIVGRSWSGYVGIVEDGVEIESSFYFGADGFGEERQYWPNGRLLDSYTFRWEWADSYNNDLVLDYGRHGISYMEDLHVSGGCLYGIFFLDQYDRGYDFKLYMD